MKRRPEAHGFSLEALKVALLALPIGPTSRLVIPHTTGRQYSVSTMPSHDPRPHITPPSAEESVRLGESLCSLQSFSQAVTL